MKNNNRKTTEKGTATVQSNIEESDEATGSQSLPDLLSSVTKHPDCPTDIYNDLLDSLGDLDTENSRTSPEFISRAIYGDKDEAPGASSKFDAPADSMIALLNDENTPAELHDLLAQTVDEIKNSSGVLGEPEIESAVVARGLHRIYGKEGASATTTPRTIEQRAEAIINDPATYEEETRLDLTQHEADEPSMDDPRTDHIFKTATFKDARRIVHRDSLMRKEWDDEAIADLLALMACLTYCDRVEREGILYEVVNAFMSSIDRSRKATEMMLVERFQSDETGEW